MIINHKKKNKKLQIICLVLMLVSASANLAFASMPDPITDLKAVGSDRQVKLSWTAPNGGSAITGYKVKYGENLSLNCETTECTDTIPGATITGVANWNKLQFQVEAINADGQTSLSNTVATTPVPCDLRSNLEIGGQTVSDQCVQISIKPGTLFISKLPGSFTFPIKHTTERGNNQASFSNPKGKTGPNDLPHPKGRAPTDDEDTLTITDLRNKGGFSVTISADPVRSGENEIPLNSLYIVTSDPSETEFKNADLRGNQKGGIRYAKHGKGQEDVEDTVDTDLPVNLVSTFFTSGTSFDPDNDGVVNPVVLMNTNTPHVGSFTTAISFLLDIPGDTPAGKYGTRFTVDLVAEGIQT